jgi:hypothetical protein
MIESCWEVSLFLVALNLDIRLNLGFKELARGRIPIFIAVGGVEKANTFLNCTANKMLANARFDTLLMVLKWSELKRVERMID